MRLHPYDLLPDEKLNRLKAVFDDRCVLRGMPNVSYIASEPSVRSAPIELLFAKLRIRHHQPRMEIAATPFHVRGRNRASTNEPMLT
jgi:hypothetical protein